MTIWTDFLDQIVDGTATPPPMVVSLKLPQIDGWAPNSVWGDWPLDKDVYHAGGSVFGGYLGQVTEAVRRHDLCGLFGLHLGGNRLRVLRHPLRHRRGGEVLAGCRRAQHVSLGEDPGEPTAFQDDGRAEASFHHRLCGRQ